MGSAFRVPARNVYQRNQSLRSLAICLINSTMPETEQRNQSSQSANETSPDDASHIGTLIGSDAIPLDIVREKKAANGDCEYVLNRNAYSVHKRVEGEPSAESKADAVREAYLGHVLATNPKAAKVYLAARGASK